jgi:hypothetical protein
MNSKQEQQLIEILQKHYEHPDKLELNVPYLVLFKELKEFYDRKG